MLEFELVDIGFANPDEVGFGGYPEMVMGYGENFLDSVSDSVSSLADLTNIAEPDIMIEVKEKYPEKFQENFGPANTIDSAPVGVFYTTAMRFKC